MVEISIMMVQTTNDLLYVPTVGEIDAMAFAPL
jgi:hypothetical protein